MPNPSIDTLMNAVKKYAREHYEEGCWSNVIECMEDIDIALIIGDHVTTEEGAIKKMAEYLAPLADRKRDIEGEIF